MVDLDGLSQGVGVDSPGAGILLAGSAVNLRVRYLRPRRPCRPRGLVSCFFHVLPPRNVVVAWRSLSRDDLDLAPLVFMIHSLLACWDFTPRRSLRLADAQVMHIVSLARLRAVSAHGALRWFPTARGGPERPCELCADSKTACGWRLLV